MRVKSLKSLVAVILLGALAAFGVRQLTPDAPAPRAVNGVLDLRGHDFDRQQSVPLDGEWRFYWQRFVAAPALTAADAPRSDGVLDTPGSWNDRSLDGQRLGADGYATLYLRVLTRASQAPLALRLVGYYPANRVWINGRLASETGHLGQRADDEVMNHALQIIDVPNDGQALDLVIHVSNFQKFAAGTTPIELGRATQIETRQIRRWSLAMFSAGTLLLMGFYHLALYAFRRTDAAPLYLGLNCLFWVGHIVCLESSEWAIRIFLPDAPGAILFRVWPSCLFLASALAYQFYRALYPHEFPRWIGKAIWGISLIYLLIALAAPIPRLAQALPVYYLITLARMSFSAWALLQAARRRRLGARIILGGYLLMLVLSINDMLNGVGFIHTVLVLHLGMIVYMFSQALALALRFSALHRAVEKLSSALDSKNRKLGDEIAERTRLQHEIVSVSEEERRRISHELHDGLCQQLTGARLQCAGLQTLWPPGAAGVDELGRLSTLLDASVDHAYDLAHGLWPLPPDSDDVGATLATLVQRQRETSPIAIEFTWINRCTRCASRHTPQIYGIAREAIGNAIKHARATHIGVSLDCSAGHGLTLRVTDDGRHQRPAHAKPGGLGLRIMAYRAQMAGGDFRIEATPTGGSCVRCTLPCAVRADDRS